MGDIASSDDPTKSTTESTASRTINDNVKDQKQSKVFKTNIKSNEHKKVQILRRFFYLFCNYAHKFINLL